MVPDLESKIVLLSAEIERIHKILRERLEEVENWR
jgi:uncharacterized small protein (DUF1192 family)